MPVPRVRSLTFDKTLYLYSREDGVFEVPMASWLDDRGSHNWAHLLTRSGPIGPGYYTLDSVRGEWVVNHAARIPWMRADWQGPYFTGWRDQRIFQGELTRSDAEAGLALWLAQ